MWSNKTFCDDGNIAYVYLFNKVAICHLWLAGTYNMASATEKQEF